MKLAKTLWITGSFLIIILILGYVLLLDPPHETGPARLDYVLDNWGMYSFLFKTEFAMGILLCIAAFMLAVHFKNSWFVLIAVGELLYAIPFPLVLGVYPEAAGEVSIALSHGSHLFVTVGMMISLGGFLGLHWHLHVLPRWLHLAAVVAVVGSFSPFLLAFIGLFEPIQAQKSMILVAVLYIINGIYGFRLQKTAESGTVAQ